MAYKLGDYTEPAAILELPCNAIRKALVAGDYAKVVFLGEHPHERIWVLITARAERGEYVGTLANDPQFSRAVKYGDPIEFSWNHIIDVDLQGQRAAYL